ncbi:MAG: hypothetical protein M3409_01200 [Gemmatimonadota bacterium]|nr:hypothetical protein [Gemmatimonadota bacterium]
MNPPNRTAAIRLVFADEGAFHSETVQVPTERIARYERLIDLLREDESVTRHLYLDLGRLVSAYVAEDES